MSSLKESVLKAAARDRDSDLRTISLEAVRSISVESGLTRREVEIESLRMEVIPERYVRNLGVLGIKGQIKLLESRIAVIGAGGIGGGVIECLGRLGIGQLLIVDPDRFEESNLNRQILSLERNLGESKSDAAADRVRRINSSVEVENIRVIAESGNLEDILSGVDVAVDALDSLEARLTLERAAREMRIPLVHAAIAGPAVEVMTILPEGPGLLEIYKEKEAPKRGAEAILGTPVQSALFAASLEAQEVVKILTGTGNPLSGALHLFDLETGECRKIEVKGFGQ
jgi:molybdopterin/thiamine biosynthesis adenylyltransferase